MSAIILLLGASLSVAVLFLGAFVWSVKHHQFDDGFSPPHRILFDDHQKNSVPPNPDKTDFRTLNQN